MLSGEKEEKARGERETSLCSTAVSDLLDDRRRHENGWRVIFHCSKTASELLLVGQRPSQMCEYAYEPWRVKTSKFGSVEDVRALSQLIHRLIKS